VWKSNYQNLKTRSRRGQSELHNWENGWKGYWDVKGLERATEVRKGLAESTRSRRETASQAGKGL
jgi:hypothetical protein